MSNEITLQPCPCCGSPARMSAVYENGDGEPAVECSACGLLSWTLADWNRRAAVEADRRERGDPDKKFLSAVLDLCNNYGGPTADDCTGDYAWVGDIWRTAEALLHASPPASRTVPSDDIDIEDVREYLAQWGCLAHPGVRALLSRYGQPAERVESPSDAEIIRAMSAVSFPFLPGLTCLETEAFVIRFVRKLLSGQPAASAEPVAYRLMRKNFDGVWTTDGRPWCDGTPDPDLLDFLVRVWNLLPTWAAEDWNELLERNPGVVDLLRPLVAGTQPVVNQSLTAAAKALSVVFWSAPLKYDELHAAVVGLDHARAALARQPRHGESHSAQQPTGKPGLQVDQQPAQDREDAERYRWATALDDNSETLHSIVLSYGGDQAKINERVDVYRACAARAAKERT